MKIYQQKKNNFIPFSIYFFKKILDEEIGTLIK